MPQRVQLAPLTGINLNAVEGATQQSPTVVKGFNVERQGGYSVAYGQASGAFVAYSGFIKTHSPDGMALLNDRRLLIDNEVIDLKGTSLDGTEVYLVPKVGAVASPNLIEADQYQMGAYAKDNNGNIGEFPSVTLTFTESSASISGSDYVVSGTYRFIGIPFAPTAFGPLAYDMITEDYVVSSNIMDLTITTSGTLPPGYLMRVYFMDVNDTVDQTFYIVNFEKVSNGVDPISFTVFDTYETLLVPATSKQNPTSDAILSFNSNLVEIHGNRVWGVANNIAFTGPFAAKVSGEKYFLTQLDAANEFIAETSSNSVFSSLSTEFYGFAEFSLGVDWRTLIEDNDVNAVWYLPFFKRDLQVEGGLKISRVDGAQSAVFYMKVNGVESTIGSVIPTEVGLTEFVNEATLLKGKNVSFITDLSSSGSDAVKIIVTDGALNEQYRFEESLPGSWDASFDSVSSSMSVVGLVDASSTNFASARVGLYEIEFYDDVSGTNLISNATADDYSTSSTSWTASSTSEVWALNSTYAGVFEASYQSERSSAKKSTSTGGGVLPAGLDSFSGVNYLDVLANLPRQQTLIYSNVRRVNLGTFENYVFLDFHSSEGVTGLRSTPAGLIVFGDNETFLVKGDPDLGTLEVQRVFGSMGNDRGVLPGLMGGIVFPIWRGRVYSMALGMGDIDFGTGVQDISEPVFDPDDVFVQVVGDPRRRHVVAATRSGKVLRYNPSQQVWYTDVYSEASGFRSFIANGDLLGVRYQLSDGLYVLDDVIATPVIKFENIDLGDKLLRKHWRRFYLYTNDSYSGTPTMSFQTESSSSTISGSEEGPGEFVFTLSQGVTSSKLKSVQFNLVGAVLGDTVEAPVEVEFTPRYRRR